MHFCEPNAPKRDQPHTSKASNQKESERKRETEKSAPATFFRGDRELELDTHVFSGRTNWCCGWRDWWSRPRPRGCWPPPSRRAAARGRRRRPPRPPGTATSSTRRPAATAAAVAAAAGGGRRPALRRRRLRRRRWSSSRAPRLQLPTRKRQRRQNPLKEVVALFCLVQMHSGSVCLVFSVGAYTWERCTLHLISQSRERIQQEYIKCNKWRLRLSAPLFSMGGCWMRCGNRRRCVWLWVGSGWVHTHTWENDTVGDTRYGAVAVPVHKTHSRTLLSVRCNLSPTRRAVFLKTFSRTDFLANSFLCKNIIVYVFSRLFQNRHDSAEIANSGGTVVREEFSDLLNCAK